MNFLITHESLMYSVYFAPRGKKRLSNLGYQLSLRYLSPNDKLIGVIGNAGAGKSLLISGIFPELRLTNDDSGINVRPLPLLEAAETGFFTADTYHLDIRFEMAFLPLYQLAELIKEAIRHERRVIVEHFDLIYPFLKQNAEILIGIGEEVIVTRPNLFGPLPQDLVKIVFKSLRYRKMAHTAEDLTGLAICRSGYQKEFHHDDVKHGFVLQFIEKPNFDLEKVAVQVNEYIQAELSVNFLDEEHIKISNEKITCTGPRLHLKNTREIDNFQLLKEWKYDPVAKLYLLIGLVGNEHPMNWDDLNNLVL